jgi:hypothetical protein
MGVLIGTAPYRFISVDDAVSGKLLIAALSARRVFCRMVPFRRRAKLLFRLVFFEGTETGQVNSNGDGEGSETEFGALELSPQ